MIIASNPNSSLSRFGEMGWMLGFMTGNSSGVSTVTVFVFSLPIRASMSFSFTSKLISVDLDNEGGLRL